MMYLKKKIHCLCKTKEKNLIKNYPMEYAKLKKNKMQKLHLKKYPMLYGKLNKLSKINKKMNEDVKF